MQVRRKGRSLCRQGRIGIKIMAGKILYFLTMSLKYSSLKTTLAVVSFIISFALLSRTPSLIWFLMPRPPRMSISVLNMSWGAASLYAWSFLKMYWTVGNSTMTRTEATMLILNSRLDMNDVFVTDLDM